MDYDQISIFKTILEIDYDEKETSTPTYVNIYLLTNSLWRTQPFDMDNDLRKIIPNHFWGYNNTFILRSNPITFLDGYYCDTNLAKRILKMLISNGKLLLPVSWKKLDLILSFFEGTYITKNITEYQRAEKIVLQNIPKGYELPNSLGMFQIFPVKSSIPQLLQQNTTLNFYNPLIFLRKITAIKWNNLGYPVFPNKLAEKEFMDIFNEPKIIKLKLNNDAIGLNRQNILMDSLVFQKLLLILDPCLLSHNDGDFSEQFTFASYRDTREHTPKLIINTTSSKQTVVSNQRPIKSSRLKLKRKKPIEPRDEVAQIIQPNKVLCAVNRPNILPKILNHKKDFLPLPSNNEFVSINKDDMHHTILESKSTLKKNTIIDEVKQNNENKNIHEKKTKIMNNFTLLTPVHKAPIVLNLELKDDKNNNQDQSGIPENKINEEEENLTELLNGQNLQQNKSNNLYLTPKNERKRTYYKQYYEQCNKQNPIIPKDFNLHHTKLLASKPRFLSPTNQMNRRKIKNKQYYEQCNKQNPILPTDFNLYKTKLLASKPRFLSPTDQMNRRKLKDRLRLNKTPTSYSRKFMNSMLEGYNLLSVEEKQSLSNNSEDNVVDSKNNDYVNNDDGNKVRLINLIENNDSNPQILEQKEEVYLLNIKRLRKNLNERNRFNNLNTEKRNIIKVNQTERFENLSGKLKKKRQNDKDRYDNLDIKGKQNQRQNESEKINVTQTKRKRYNTFKNMDPHDKRMKIVEYNVNKKLAHTKLTTTEIEKLKFAKNMRNFLQYSESKRIELTKKDKRAIYGERSLLDLDLRFVTKKDYHLLLDLQSANDKNIKDDVLIYLVSQILRLNNYIIKFFKDIEKKQISDDDENENKQIYDAFNDFNFRDISHIDEPENDYPTWRCYKQQKKDINPKTGSSDVIIIDDNKQNLIVQPSNKPLSKKEQYIVEFMITLRKFLVDVESRKTDLTKRDQDALIGKLSFFELDLRFVPKLDFFLIKDLQNEKRDNSIVPGLIRNVSEILRLNNYILGFFKGLGKVIVKNIVEEKLQHMFENIPDFSFRKYSYLDEPNKLYEPINLMSPVNIMDIKSPIINFKIYTTTTTMSVSKSNVHQQFPVYKNLFSNIYDKIIRNNFLGEHQTLSKQNFHFPTHLICDKEIKISLNSDVVPLFPQNINDLQDHLSNPCINDKNKNSVPKKRRNLSLNKKTPKRKLMLKHVKKIFYRGTKI